MLDAAVEQLGGEERPGQVAMAEAVAAAMDDRRHLLVQAGTGTGKSLGYLVPGAAARRPGRGRDGDAGAAAPARRARHPARCSRRPSDLLDDGGTRTPCSRGAPTTPACTASARACPTTRARWSTCPRARWAPRWSRCASGSRRRRPASGTGERDHAPRHTDRVWRQVSVSHRECLGAPSARYGAECFAERAKEQAAALAADRHQPLAARDRRDRGRADDPGVRRGGDRRGPRAGRAGDPGRHRRAVRRRRSTGPPGAAQRHVEGTRPTTWPTPARCCATRIDDCRSRPDRPRSRAARRRAGAGPRRGPRAGLGVPASDPGRGDAGAHPGQGLGPGAVRDRRADGGRLGQGRALDERARAQPRRQPAVRRAARGRRADARAAARREDRGLHLARPSSWAATSTRSRRRSGCSRPSASRSTEVPPSAPTTAAWQGLDVGSPFDYGQQAILYVARAPARRRAATG